MKVLIAPNAFKGTLSAEEAGAIIASFCDKNYSGLQTQVIPIADGGDGTCNLLSKFLNLEQVNAWTLDPIGRPRIGFFGFEKASKKAYLDVSTASGIALIGDSQKNPWVTSTFGTGLLIRKAIRMGAKEIILGLGGSATVDLGLGILQALGFVFLDQNGREVLPFTDQVQQAISHIQSPVPMPNIHFTCLCDVRNQFFGNNGAIPVFGPQKGLKSEELSTFEVSSEKNVTLLFKKAKKEFVDRSGFGAAGGIALGLSAFFNTDIEFGSPYFFERIGLEDLIKESDWVITGEGRYDAQSEDGKACFELLKLCRKHGKKSVLISSGEEGEKAGFDHFVKLEDLDFLSQSLKNDAETALLKSLSLQLDLQ
ncbi:glycerate kinase [Algoriphagus algorifonticola]|uniref:glycerate kinase n=1 Tax=Algoriphagus algorifonticola TaxID=2593007 RepID=UPI0011A37803|nr:glycerate kinase [Algoriphagus algorifonticola]